MVMAKTKKKKKIKKRPVNILSLYPEDFESGKIWFDVCNVLGISPLSESADITFTKVTNT
jgi:hypothetical protein